MRYGVTAIISGRADCALDGLPFVLLRREDMRADLPPVPTAPTESDTPIRIAQSSGTSGDPKGVMLTHGITRDRFETTVYGMTSKSRVLLMDLNFVASFNYALCTLAIGAAIVFVAAETPDDTIDAVRRFAVTDWVTSPAIVENIAARLSEDAIHFGTLHHLRVVGASPSAKLVDTLFKRFTPNVHVGYGLTEMGQVAIATPEMLKREPATVGPVLAPLEAQIVDEHDEALPVGQRGILRLRAPRMLPSYYPDDGLTTDRFRDGWYYPRDLARLNEDGWLFIEGRQDDVLNIGGVKVHFRDVERVMEAHPAVKEAAVFVAISPEGREGMALAYIAEAVTPAASSIELQAYARAKLGPLCPGQFIAVHDLPRTLTTGKVQRDRLSTLYLDGALGAQR
jgi:acyl-coenzyme A synthetase/AMP-(fatty) acid ligase